MTSYLRHLRTAIKILILSGCSACSTPAITSGDSTPRYIIYYNSNAAPLSAAIDTAYTHIILSFVTASIDAQRQLQLHIPDIINSQWDSVKRLQAAGKKVLISFGGGEFQAADYAPLAGREKELAAALAKLVRAHGLDGIDVDYEASTTLHTQRPPGVIDGRAFLIALNRALRAHLPSPDYSISHAPQPPYLDAAWHGGPYLDVVHASAADLDWIAVQYYNNPGFDAPIASAATGDSEQAATTAFFQLAPTLSKLGLSPTQLVVGKPVYINDARSGFLPPEKIGPLIITPLRQHYGNRFGGLMGWQFSTHTTDHRYWNSTLGQTLFGARIPAAKPIQ